MTAAPHSLAGDRRPSQRQQVATRLRRLSGTADSEIALGAAALDFSAYDLGRDPAPAAGELRRLIAAVTDSVAAKNNPDCLEQRAALLAEVIAGEFGFRGDSETYDDLANGCLLQVLERQRGLPVALGILYLEAARAQGWQAEGLGFPGHFLIGLESGRQRAILDPFNGGRRLEAPELRRLLAVMEGPGAPLRPDHHAAVSNRDILLRLRNNKKLRLLKLERRGEALEVLETMLMIAPERAELWFETGYLQTEEGNLGAAILALDHCRQLDPGGTAGREAERLAKRLKLHLN